MSSYLSQVICYAAYQMCSHLAGIQPTSTYTDLVGWENNQLVDGKYWIDYDDNYKAWASFAKDKGFDYAAYDRMWIYTNYTQTTPTGKVSVNMQGLQPETTNSGTQEGTINNLVSLAKVHWLLASKAKTPAYFTALFNCNGSKPNKKLPHLPMTNWIGKKF